MKSYKLLAPDGSTYDSVVPGQLGGYRPRRIYGRLDCPSALRHLANGHYAAHRAFFAGEKTAIAAGFRPCAKCMPTRYAQWKAGGASDTAAYPWLRQPKVAPGAA